MGTKRARMIVLPPYFSKKRCVLSRCFGLSHLEFLCFITRGPMALPTW